MRNTKPEGTYATILGSDGSIRVTANEGDENAVERTYEIKEGNEIITKTKWEIVFTEIEGKIENIYFKDSKYGRTINLVIRDKDDDSIVVFQMNTATNYASDFMKKLPNIDLEFDVLLRPYCMDKENGNKNKGVSVQQGGVKLQDYFSKPDPKGKNGWEKLPTNGIPTPDEDKKPEKSKEAKWKKFWQAYFGDVEEFLVDYTEENIIPKIEVKQKEASKEALGIEETKEEGDELDEF